MILTYTLAKNKNLVSMVQNMEQKLAECKKYLAEEKARSDVIVEFYKDIMHSEKCGAHKCSYLQNNASINTSCSNQPAATSLK